MENIYKNIFSMFYKKYQRDILQCSDDSIPGTCLMDDDPKKNILTKPK